MLRLLARLLLVPCLLVGAAWLVGRVASDRWVWSQWLAWIPTLLVLPVLLAASLLAIPALAPRRAPSDADDPARPPRLPLLAGVLALAWLAACSWFLFVEHRFHRRPAEAPEGLQVLHWTFGEPLTGLETDIVSTMIELGPDVAILTDARTTRRHPYLRRWIGDDGTLRQHGPFTIATRLPVRTLRPVVRSDGIDVVLLEIETDAVSDGVLTMHLVNLPSDPELPRTALARRARGYLDEAGLGTPDLLVGDLNLTRDSHSLSVLAPGMRHAFDEAGHGYGATFHEDFPLVHIDHIMLGPDVRATRYDVVDVRVRRHLPQRAWIVAADAPGTPDAP